jgi:alkanesulfonate monooxygenase SsuD/methylene tetrahydromethanopterin reductase-like flavin-dependent oxidoreductase (luciferase family)
VLVVAEADPHGPVYRDAADLAAQIAAKVFPHVADRPRRDELAALLQAFAAEIKRSAIEP